MINFIICDDDIHITEIVKNVINKTMFPTSLEYKIHVFNKYDKEFTKIISSNLQNKIYVLDIEVGNNSGLEVAKQIREKDWDSVILILTAHYELEILAFKSRILLFDFISKFDLYDKKICDNLLACINKVLKQSKLVVKINRSVHNIEYNNILYITYDSYKRKSIIVTFSKSYEVNTTLKELKDKLKGNFIYTHRACIINVDNIEKVDFRNKIITFKNNVKIDLLSRNYLKEVRSYGFS